MKYLIVTLPLAALLMLAGCTNKVASQSAASPPEGNVPQQQASKNLSDPNIPPQVRQMLEEQQKHHGAPQRPLPH